MHKNAVEGPQANKSLGRPNVKKKNNKDVNICVTIAALTPVWPHHNTKCNYSLAIHTKQIWQQNAIYRLDCGKINCASQIQMTLYDK